MAEKLNATTTPRRKGPQVPKDDPPPAPRENGVSASAGIGDNSLTPEQEAKALRIYHVAKLRDQQRVVDKAKALHDDAKQAMTDLYHLAKGDTHYPRKELAAFIADMKIPTVELRAREERKSLLYGDWDMPVGHQPDLFDKAPQEVRDEMEAKGIGYSMGLRGDPCQMPEGMHVRFGPAFSAGWGKGQDELAWGLSEGGRLVDRKHGAKGGPTREEIERQPEPEDDPRETLPPSEFEDESEVL
jgi:hypothetical protein